MSVDTKAQGMAGASLASIAIAVPALQMPALGPLYRFIAFGDSEIQREGNDPQNVFAACDATAQIALASDGVLLPVRGGGVGGQTTPMLAADVVRRVAKFKPDVVVFQAGTNNIVIFGDTNGSPTPLSTLSADLDTIYAAIRSVGAKLFIRTIPPRGVTSNDLIWVPQANAIITAWAAANDVVLLDSYSQLNDPANPGYFKPNYSADGTHYITPAGYMMAKADWAVMSKTLLAGRKQTRPLQDVANLLFTPIATDGTPQNTSTRDALFRNFHSFTQNGFTMPVPYWVGSTSGSGTLPTVTAVVATHPGVAGNEWAVTATPNGAGTFSAQTAQGGKAIDVTQSQARRIRVSFKVRCTGFNVDNTFAYLAANGNVPLSAFGLTFACKDAAGTNIASLNVADPRDSSASLGQASTLSLRTQLLVFQQGSKSGQCYDFDLTQFHFEMCIPCGAIEINPTLQISFLAGAVSPVTVALSEFAFVDIGPADDARPVLAMTNKEMPWQDVKASKTISPAEAMSCGYYRGNAAAAPISITLPSSDSTRGRPQNFKKIDLTTNPVTLIPAATQKVSRIAVTSGGSGYTSAPAVTFSGGGGSSAIAVATIAGGAVVDITVTSGGSSYTGVPTVAFSGGGGTGAAATAMVGDTIDGAATLVLNSPNALARLLPTGSGWDAV